MTDFSVIREAAAMPIEVDTYARPRHRALGLAVTVVSEPWIPPRHRNGCADDEHHDRVSRVGHLLAWECNTCGRIEVA